MVVPPVPLVPDVLDDTFAKFPHGCSAIILGIGTIVRTPTEKYGILNALKIVPKKAVEQKPPSTASMSLYEKAILHLRRH
jgi:hypothetical protein